METDVIMPCGWAPVSSRKEQIAAAHKSLKQYEWVRDFAENNIRKHCDNDR
jgi:hypothetical protein